jgi:hypothetical protein
VLTQAHIFSQVYAGLVLHTDVVDTFNARIREVASVGYQLRQQRLDEILGTVSGLQPTGKHWNETGTATQVAVNTLNMSRDHIWSEQVRAKNLSNINGKGAQKEDQSATRKEASDLLSNRPQLQEKPQSSPEVIGIAQQLSKQKSGIQRSVDVHHSVGVKTSVKMKELKPLSRHSPSATTKVHGDIRPSGSKNSTRVVNYMTTCSHEAPKNCTGQQAYDLMKEQVRRRLRESGKKVLAVALNMTAQSRMGKPDSTSLGSWSRSPSLSISRELPEIETRWINAEAVFMHDARASPSCNKERPWKFSAETLPYLSWIVSNYQALPDYVVFLHKHDEGWHRTTKATILAKLLAALDTAAPFQSLGKFSALFFRCRGEASMKQLTKSSGPRIHLASKIGLRRMPDERLNERFCQTEPQTLGAYEVQTRRKCFPASKHAEFYPYGEDKIFERSLLPILRRTPALEGYFRRHPWRQEHAEHGSPEEQKVTASCLNWNEFFAGRGLAGEFIVSRRALLQYPKPFYDSLIARFFEDCSFFPGKKPPWSYAGERLWPLLWDPEKVDKT